MLRQIGWRLSEHVYIHKSFGWTGFRNRMRQYSTRYRASFHRHCCWKGTISRVDRQYQWPNRSNTFDKISFLNKQILFSIGSLGFYTFLLFATIYKFILQLYRCTCWRRNRIYSHFQKRWSTLHHWSDSCRLCNQYDDCCRMGKSCCQQQVTIQPYS